VQKADMGVPFLISGPHIEAQQEKLGIVSYQKGPSATEKPMRYPLDPECPVVAEFMETLFGDPTMAMGAPVEDITEEFERRHRKQCERCQEYGVRQRVTE
jgi:hypothetical protein